MIRHILIGAGLVAAVLAVITGCSSRPEFRNGQWRGSLERTDGHDIVFNFEVKDSGGRKVLIIRNAAERLLVDSVAIDGDSVRVQLPFFESQLLGAITGDGNLEGIYRIHLQDSFRWMPFRAVYGEDYRFRGYSAAGDEKPASRQGAGASGQAAGVAGRWAAVFRAADGKDTTFRVGEFQQDGNRVTGTFLDAGGDLRYLEGIIDRDTLKLSGFDGNHAFLFTARVSGDSLVDGKMYSGPAGFSTWTAARDSAAHLEDLYAITKFKKDIPFGFSFKDLDGKTVSFADDRFKGKVVLVQIMGSWCPNCMDETQFLSQFYDENRGKGVEIVSLAYERSTDFDRSVRSIRSFQGRFDVKYPMLVTGVTVTDPQRAAKTLPLLDDIHDFPTTIFVNKKGYIEKIHTGFSGPGTGEHYGEQKKEFHDQVNEMLAEK